MQLPREPLLTAEMQHLLGEHRGAFECLGMAGHQERRGKFCGREAQGMADSWLAQNVSSPAEVSELLHLPQHFLTCHLLRATEIVHQLFPCGLASLLMLPPPLDL